jgi:hypothetical protein
MFVPVYLRCVNLFLGTTRDCPFKFVSRKNPWAVPLPWFGLSHLFYDHQGSERQGTKLPEVTWLINVRGQYTGHMYICKPAHVDFAEPNQWKSISCLSSTGGITTWWVAPYCQAQVVSLLWEDTVRLYFQALVLKVPVLLSTVRAPADTMCLVLNSSTFNYKVNALRKHYFWNEIGWKFFENMA